MKATFVLFTLALTLAGSAHAATSSTTWTFECTRTPTREEYGTLPIEATFKVGAREISGKTYKPAGFGDFHKDLKRNPQHDKDGKVAFTRRDEWLLHVYLLDESMLDGEAGELTYRDGAEWVTLSCK
jgi:hypothetical protein